MINKTTVSGYKLERSHPKLGELERWSVSKKNTYYGVIVKAVLKPIAYPPLVFWYAIYAKRLGYREVFERKVANTRRDAVALLAKMKEGRQLNVQVERS